MSSFRWGIIACITQRNSQVTSRKAGALPFSHQNRIVLLTVLHTEVWLLSTSYLQHIGLSHCSLWQHINLLYTIWKGTYRALIWGIRAWSVTRGCRVIKAVNVSPKAASYVRFWAYPLSPLAVDLPNGSPLTVKLPKLPSAPRRYLNIQKYAKCCTYSTSPNKDCTPLSMNVITEVH